MNKVFKENSLLIIGASLPIVVIVIFLLATYLPKLWVKPPEYSFIYLVHHYNNPNTQNFVHIESKNGELEAWAEKGKPTPQNVQMYVYDSKAQASREIPIPAVNFSDTPDAQIIPVTIPEIQNLTVSNSTTAPDGYTITMPSPYGGMSSLFYSNSNKQTLFVLSKNGNKIEVPSPLISQPYLSTANFLGWIISPAK